MSTKTIALETSIYERLADLKRDGESFSKVIDRLLSQVANAHTGADILEGLTDIAPLLDQDAEKFLAAVAENRDNEDWSEP